MCEVGAGGMEEVRLGGEHIVSWLGFALLLRRRPVLILERGPISETLQPEAGRLFGVTESLAVGGRCETAGLSQDDSVKMQVNGREEIGLSPTKQTQKHHGCRPSYT